MKRLILNILFQLILVFSVFAFETEIYVSKSGNDASPGTKEKPLATFEGARDLIRKYKTIKEYPVNGFTVWVDEGEYYQEKPFVLNENDCGEPNNPVVWRAVKNKNVRITGGISLPVTGFQKISDETVFKRLTKEAGKNVVCISLPEFGITDFGNFQQIGHALPVVPASLELFFNNKPMTLARYPNSGFVQIEKVIDGGSVPRTGDYSQRGATIEYSDERHSVWAGQNDVWFQGTFFNGYADDMLPVEKIDTLNKTIKFSSPHMYGVRGGMKFTEYVALNILDELDMPGEWYLDRKSGMLYFWPTGELSEGSIKISILEDPIVCLEGVSNIVFRDITIENGRGIGVYMERGNNNLLAGCTIRNVGTAGICMGQGAKQTVPYITHDHYEGVPVSRRIGNYAAHLYKYTTWNRQAGKNNKILSCNIYNSGSGGIILSGGSKKNLINGNNVVENCKIHDYNRRNKFRWAGIIVDGCGNRVSHCEVFNSDFHGIFSVGNEHIFEYNNIHHVTLHSDDVSAWYTGRDPSDRGLIIRYNYFHHCGNSERMNMGIYCDDSATGITVFGNVFYKMQTNHGVFFSNGAWDLKMNNNIIIEPHSYTVVLSAQYYIWAKKFVLPFFGENGLFQKRLLEDINITKPPFSERYPELVNYMEPIIYGQEWEGMRTRRNVLSNNVILGGTENPILLNGGPYAVCGNINNYQTSKDPGFLDYENENFMLKKDAEVFEKLPEFEPVPFDKMGLYVDEFRENL